MAYMIVVTNPVSLAVHGSFLALTSPVIGERVVFHLTPFFS